MRRLNFTFDPDGTLAEWRANVSAQELQETEDHHVYAELQVKQLRTEG